MKRYKLGRKPAIHNLRTMRRALVIARYLTPLGSAPANSADFVTATEAQLPRVNGSVADWGMFGNGPDPANPPTMTAGCGDCVECDDAHMLELWTANTGTIVIPSTQQVVALYSAETGFDPAAQLVRDPATGNMVNPTDGGTDIGTNCQYLIDTGFLSHKIQGKGQVDPSNLDHVKWSIQIFGGLKIGIQLPDYAEDAFSTGVWDYQGQSYQIEGGHDVPIIRYTTDATDGIIFDTVTWGRRIQMTLAFFQKFCDQAEVASSRDFVTSKGLSPAGFSVDQMTADLAAVSSGADLQAVAQSTPQEWSVVAKHTAPKPPSGRGRWIPISELPSANHSTASSVAVLTRILTDKLNKAKSGNFDPANHDGIWVPDPAENTGGYPMAKQVREKTGGHPMLYGERTGGYPMARYIA